MSTELAKPVVDPFVEMVERLATNKDVDPDKLEKLVDIQMRILDRNAEAEFNAAMARVQANIPSVLRNARNPQTGSDYASHEAVCKAIRPAYSAEGFSVSFSQGKADRDDYMRVDGVLRHSSGHSERYFLDLPPDDRGIKGSINKTAIHAAGSTFTYARRYLTLLMFDIATGDDADGNTPNAGLTEEQELNLQAVLEGLSEAAQADFWSKVHCEPGEYDHLKAHRYQSYIRFLNQKRAEDRG